jgi:uroporphyrinogen-III synthase
MKDKATRGKAAHQSLAGLRVLVGRARHQASALSSELRKLGATVLEIPFIEIRKPRSFKPLDSALKNLREYDWLILTSVNGVEAMWERMDKLKIDFKSIREGREFTRASHSNRQTPALAARVLSIAAIGPATKKAIEQRGAKVDVVPKEYVAESVVRSLRQRVKGRSVLLVRAKVARDVIPNELRKAGAHVDVVEAYETVVPEASRRRLQAAFRNPQRSPHVVTFTSSSTVRNFVELVGGSRATKRALSLASRPGSLSPAIRLASIGPVTSATLRNFELKADIAAKQYTIPGLVRGIAAAIGKKTDG